MTETQRIEYLPLSDLQFNPANPKAHREDMIARSVTEFGYVEPVVIDERTGYLIAGHGRVGALRNMQAHGDEPPPGVTAIDDEWMLPVVVGWGSQDDAHAAGVLIALNRITEMSGWDNHDLHALLTELVEADETLRLLAGTGFTEADIELLRAAETDLESAADAFEEWRSMSEYQSENLLPHARITVLFETQADVVEFAKRLGYPDDYPSKVGRTGNKSAWFPWRDREDRVSFELVADEVDQ